MERVVEFILELEKLKAVTRKVRPVGLERYENSAEHSWQIALLAASLVEHAAEPVDLDRVIRMLLVHDVGEIDAGDVMAFHEAERAAVKGAEAAAVRRIFGLLGEAPAADFLTLWDEFEAAETPEARFAHAADRAMPVLLNLANGGQSWREHGIRYEQVVRRVGPEVSAGCPALWAYLEARLAEQRDAGWFGID